MSPTPLERPAEPSEPELVGVAGRRLGEGASAAANAAVGELGMLRLAADPVVVSIETVDVIAVDVDGTLHVFGTVAGTARAVDIAGDRNASARVVRVAFGGRCWFWCWLRLRCWLGLGW